MFGILALAPHPALAAEATFFDPIIPPECHCVGSAPDFKCVLAVMQNVVNFAISIGVIIFVLVCAYAGFLFMFSSINAENKSKAKNILTNAVVGLLLALAAWLLVDFIMKTLYNEKWGPWNSILGNAGSMCLATHTPPAATGTTGGGDGVTTVTPPDTDITGGFEVGMHVECNKGGQGTYLPAVVNGISEDTGGGNPRVSVCYDGQTRANGGCEDLISADRCRIPSGTTGGGLPANGSVTVAGGSCAGNTAACGPNLRCGLQADGANKDKCIATTATASCPVPAVTPLTDALALRMEGGATVIWDRTDSRLQSCANRFIAAAGGGSVTSAYRPDTYQTHLWELRDRWCTQGLRSNTTSACSALKSNISAEISKHGLSSCGAVGRTSRHTAGTGVDIRLNSGNYSGTASLARESCLAWANYDGDPWHYNLVDGCSCQ